MNTDEEQLRHSLQQARSALGEMSRKYLEERSRVEAAEAKVAAVEALHLQDADGWCESDGFCWPCPTARALAISADSFSRVRGPIGP